MPGWMTVWLSLGPDGCKVELFLGGIDLDIGGAGLGSGGWGTSSLGKEPWTSVACALRQTIQNGDNHLKEGHFNEYQ